MSVTLANAQALGLDDKQAALAEEIITVDELFSVLPFIPVSGNAYAWEREDALVTAAALGIGGSFTPGQSTYTQKSIGLTTLGAQVELNKLIQNQGVGALVDGGIQASQLARAAKSVARKFQEQFILGDGTNDTMTGLDTVMADSAFAGQLIDAGDAVLTLDMLDDLIASVKLRRADAIVATQRGRNKIKSLLRSAGGVTYSEIAGRQMMTYDGIPILANDWITGDVDGSTAGKQQGIYAVCLGEDGVAALTTGDMPGVNAEYVGVHQTKDQDIWRVKLYANVVVHSTKAIAKLVSATV
jgi:HK97 family phage major capsid protein